MAWTVILEDEHKEMLSRLDEEFASERLFDEAIRSDFKLLKYLDPYGDTIFNNVQMSDLVSDLKLLQEKEKDENTLIQNIINLANRCETETHVYLVFYGD